MDKQKDESEIVNVVAMNTIISDVINTKENTKEEVQIPDYVGMAGEKLKDLFKEGIEKGTNWLSKTKTNTKNAINKGIYNTINTYNEIKDARIESKIAKKELKHREKRKKAYAIYIRTRKNIYKSSKESLFTVIKGKVNDLKAKGLDALAKDLENAKELALTGLDAVVNAPNEMKNKFISTKDRVITGAKGFAGSVKKEFKGKQSELVSAITNKIKGWKSKGKEAIAQNLENSKFYIGVAKDAIQPITEKIVDKAKDVGDFAKNAVSDPKVAAENLAFNLGSFTEKTVTNVKDKVISAKNKVVSTKDKVIKGAKGFAGKVSDKVDNYRIQASLIKSTYKGKSTELKKAISSKINEWKGKESLAENLGIAKDTIINAKENVVNTVKSGIEFVSDKKDKIISAASDINKSFNDGRDFARKQAKETVKSGVENMKNTVAKATEVTEKVHDGLENKSKTLNPKENEQKSQREDPVADEGR